MVIEQLANERRQVPNADATLAKGGREMLEGWRDTLKV
jgi:hypothetical protein